MKRLMMALWLKNFVMYVSTYCTLNLNCIIYYKGKVLRQRGVAKGGAGGAGGEGGEGGEGEGVMPSKQSKAKIKKRSEKDFKV